MKYFDYLFLRVGLGGTEEESYILNIGRLTLKNAEKMGPWSKPEDLHKLNEFRERLERKISNYHGKFSNYFKNLLDEINLENKLIYHVNSD